MKEIFPEPEYELHPLRRGPRRLAGQAPARPRHPPALGDRARLPDRRDLLARRPLLLLEPVGDAARPTPRSSRRIGSARTSSTTPPAASCPPTSSTVREVTDFKAASPPSAGPCRSPSSATPATGTSPRWPIPNLMTTLRDKLELRRRDQPQGALPARPEPGQLPADLHPRPGRARRSARRTWTPSAGTSTRAAAPSSPTPPAAARPSTPPSASSSPSCSPTTRSSRSPATTRSTPRKVGYDLSDVQYSKAAGGGKRLPPARRASRSTATGRSSTPSTTSAAPSNATRGSTARATPTRAPCGSPPTSSSTPRSLEASRMPVGESHRRNPAITSPKRKRGFNKPSLALRARG